MDSANKALIFVQNKRGIVLLSGRIMTRLIIGSCCIIVFHNYWKVSNTCSYLLQRGKNTLMITQTYKCTPLPQPPSLLFLREKLEPLITGDGVTHPCKWGKIFPDTYRNPKLVLQMCSLHADLNHECQ